MIGAINQVHTTQREAAIPKSDVWKSVDGKHWVLVTPGCKAPQSSLVPDGNPRDGKHGKAIYVCSSDEDCYGAEICDVARKTCVCNMWTSREQHAVAVYGDFIYLTGGYASFLYSQRSACGPYPCGDTDASSYRYHMNDVWRSRDGLTWEVISQAAAFAGRGAHQMLVVPDVLGVPYLWVVGGRGGDNTGLSRVQNYYNDIWTSPLVDKYPSTWILQSNLTARRNASSNPLKPTSTTMPWTPRMGHTVTLQSSTASNGNVRTLYLVGGRGKNGKVFDDVWSWRIDEDESGWIQDFTPEALYSTVYKSKFGYFNNSPLVEQYVTPDSDIRLMQRYFVPSYPVDYPGQPLEKRLFLTPDRIRMLRSVGINTIKDFATADKYAILKLRGFDIPQIPLKDRLTFTDACDFRALAIGLMKKCELSTAFDRYYSEASMPWNIVPQFGGPPPVKDPVAWHGSDYATKFASNLAKTREQRTVEWDGCSFLEGMSMSGYGSPNVLNIGSVTQVENTRSPLLELENLGCKQTPGPRVHHAAIIHQERLFVFGGKDSDSKFHADGWYRDSSLPNAYINTKPSTRTSQTYFTFTSDKAGSYFEYRIWAPADYKLIREWTPVVFQTDVSWLDSRKNGPGTGLYAMYVRAVDPAGNRDVYFSEGRNVYTWVYVTPIPWDLILGGVGGALGLLIIMYIEYRRRKKKAAMERYALKRMRRKFKALQKDADDKGTDWRTLYNENKMESDAVKRKKALKRARNANEGRIQKDAANRDKEKDVVKVKMHQKKEQLRRKRLNDGGQYGFGERTEEDLEKGSAGKSKGRSVASEVSEAPTRIKKSDTRRKKPGGYQAKDYEVNALAGDVSVGLGGEGAGVKKRKVANKRTKDFEVIPEDDGKNGGPPQKEE